MTEPRRRNRMDADPSLRVLSLGAVVEMARALEIEEAMEVGASAACSPFQCRSDEVTMP